MHRQVRNSPRAPVIFLHCFFSPDSHLVPFLHFEIYSVGSCPFLCKFASLFPSSVKSSLHWFSWSISKWLQSIVGSLRVLLRRLWGGGLGKFPSSYLWPIHVNLLYITINNTQCSLNNNPCPFSAETWWNCYQMFLPRSCESPVLDLTSSLSLFMNPTLVKSEWSLFLYQGVYINCRELLQHIQIWCLDYRTPSVPPLESQLCSCSIFINDTHLSSHCWGPVLETSLISLFVLHLSFSS